MHTFFTYFISFLHKNKIRYTHNLLSNFDILFVNSWVVPYLKVYAATIILRNVKIVQRIDGSAQDYGRGTVWDYRQAKVNRITDLTIFQSKYGRYATREKFGVIRKDGPVIHNPVDTELFAPDGTRSSIPSSPRIGYVGFSTNPKKGVDQFFVDLFSQHTDCGIVSFWDNGREFQPRDL